MGPMRGRSSSCSTSRSSRESAFDDGEGRYAYVGASIFIWEIFPEWMFPLLTGFSIFCLANPKSPDFTRIFGGSNGNEGLGLLSLCLDWQYISGGVNPMAIPLRAQVMCKSA